MPDPNNHQPPSEGLFILIGVGVACVMLWGFFAFVIPV